MRDQTHLVKHLSKESGCITTSRKAKHVNIITRRIILHEELISSNNMLVEGRADSAILGLLVLVLQFLDGASGTQRGGGDVRPNTRLVIMEVFA
jgi:hypothetical protein